MRKLKITELNRVSKEEFKKIDKLPLVVVLDEVRSLYNVGSVFRSSDAFAVSAVYLCGITAVPPNAEIHKTALGAEESVDWKYFKRTQDAVNELKRQIGGQYIYFLAGMCIYFYYQQVHSQVKWLLPVSVVVFLVGSYYDSWEYLTAFCYAVIIMELSLNAKVLSRFSEVPNVTYGLYLYHFPVVQILLHFKVNEWSHTGCCLLCLGIVTLLSIMNYQLIEKRIK